MRWPRVGLSTVLIGGLVIAALLFAAALMTAGLTGDDGLRCVGDDTTTAWIDCRGASD